MSKLPVDTPRLYEEFEETLREVVSQTVNTYRDFGYLGYEVNGVFSVISPDNPAKFYVTMKDGSFKEVFHRGKVAPNPQMPVEIRYVNDDPTQDRSGYIYGVNEDEIRSYSNKITASANVGIHSHHRGSGMEFPVDLRLIYQLSVRPSPGTMVVNVNSGFYFNASNALRWYAGGALNLTSLKPVAAAYKRWVLIGLDPATSTLVTAASTPVPGFATLTEAVIETLTLTPADSIPLAAVKVFQNKNSLYEMDFVALYRIAAMAGAAGSGDSNLIGYPNPVTEPWLIPAGREMLVNAIEIASGGEFEIIGNLVVIGEYD
jgi:hypothetical protein